MKAAGHDPDAMAIRALERAWGAAGAAAGEAAGVSEEEVSALVAKAAAWEAAEAEVVDAED